MGNHLFYFVIRVLLWLPIMFLLWYYLQTPINAVVALMVEQLTLFFSPDIFTAIKSTGRQLEIVTQLIINLEQSEQQGYLVFMINPMIYGFGLPFFIAIILAIPEAIDINLPHIALSVMIILLSQLWGIIFDIYKSVIFVFHSNIGDVLILNTFQTSLFAYAYQMGSLIFPVVIPVVLWLWVGKEFWQQWSAIKL